MSRYTEDYEPVGEDKSYQGWKHLIPFRSDSRWESCLIKLLVYVFVCFYNSCVSTIQTNWTLNKGTGSLNPMK